MNGLTLRSDLALVTAVTTCFLTWILGTMWSEAARVSSSAAQIASPAFFLWSAQLALSALLFRADAVRTGFVCIAVIATPMPVWVLLGLVEIVPTATLLRVHLATALIGLLLTGLAFVLRRISNENLRACLHVGIQALCAVALFGVAYRLWYWVSG